jgi:hypothetical protein
LWATRNLKVVSVSSTVTDTSSRPPSPTLWPKELRRLLVMIQLGRKTLLNQKPLFRRTCTEMVRRENSRPEAESRFSDSLASKKTPSVSRYSFFIAKLWEPTETTDLTLSLLCLSSSTPWNLQGCGGCGGCCCCCMASADGFLRSCARSGVDGRRLGVDRRREGVP